MEASLKRANKKPSIINRIFSHIFETPKRTIIYTCLLLSFFLTIYFLIIYFVRRNIYCAFSDDTVQYYPFMVDFIDQIKSGDFSYFNYKNYLGASFYSDAYYIPLDPFTLVILLLSFLMKTEVAMSIVELLKFVVGVACIQGYLALKGVKNKNIHIIGLLYFSCSGITCFSCFPSFTSLAVYLPLSLVVGELFLRGKWYIVPLFSLVVIFYNFYLAYTVFAFMAFSILVMSILRKKRALKVILDVLKYVALILLGLLMGMSMFLPSVLFILNSTTRAVVEGTSSLTRLMYMLLSYFDVIWVAIKSSIKLLVNIIVYPIGFFKNNTMIRDSFVDLRYLVAALKTNYVLDGKQYFASFFNDEVFYRVMGSTFTPSWPSAFYGYLDSYFLEHASLYITGSGVLIGSYVVFLKDRTSRVYKVMMIIILLFMSLPIFSYIFSANLEVLYTRWMNVIDIPLLLITAHVLENVDLKDIKPGRVLILFIIFLYLATVSTYHHLVKLTELIEINKLSENTIYFMNVMYYSAGGVIGSFLLFFVLLYVSKNLKKKTKAILYPVLAVLLLGGVVMILYNLYEVYSGLTAEALKFDLTVKKPLYSPEGQIGIQYMSIATLLLIMISAFALIANKKKLLYGVIALEVIISACFSFAGPVTFSGEETMYRNTHALSGTIKENVIDDTLYRIYLDQSISGILNTNTARFMPAGTNQKIFHSFINDSTDGIVELLFGVSNEGQAGKRKLNTYSYYLNNFLGYKYIVAPADSSFSSYDTDIFELVYKDSLYIILKVKNYESFLVYDSITSKKQYNDIKNKLSSVGQKVNFLSNYAVFESDYDELINKYIEYSDVSDYESNTSSNYITQRESLESVGSREFDGATYTLFEFNDSNMISTRSYAINISGMIDDATTISNNGLIKVIFSNDEVYSIEPQNKRSMNGSTYHIPVYGTALGNLKVNGSYTINNDHGVAPTPKYIAVESSYAPASLKIGIESIFPSASELESYESYELGSTATLGAYFRFNVRGLIPQDKLVTLTFSTAYTESRLVAETMDHRFINISNEFTIDEDIKYIYAYKGSYSQTFTPSITITSIVDANTYSDNYSNKDIRTKESSIILSYNNDSVGDGYSVIMIPCAYSTEWKLISGEVKEMLPVNGGFIGLIVPNNIESNTIEIEFVPSGRDKGLALSLIGFVIYASMFLLDMVWNKKEYKKKGELV